METQKWWDTVAQGKFPELTEETSSGTTNKLILTIASLDTTTGAEEKVQAVLIGVFS